MLASQSFATTSSPEAFLCSDNGFSTVTKGRKLRIPDPDAEVIALSAEALMETDHYICDICKKGFQREQNLLMHRRCHNIPWKPHSPKKRASEPRKRVYVCPEPACLHHDPFHALCDLVGIKKHFRRKHGSRKQWVCGKCSKGYALQSDYKAHLKTCGSRGHSCDCGRVFSRVDTFMEHQDKCKAGIFHTDLQQSTTACTLLTLSQDSSISTNFIADPCLISKAAKNKTLNLVNLGQDDHSITGFHPLPSLASSINLYPYSDSDEYHDSTQLKLSIGYLRHGQEEEVNYLSNSNGSKRANIEEGCDFDASEQLRIAMQEKALAEQKRREAKWQVQLAEEEFRKAKQIRQQALLELNKALVLKDLAMNDTHSKILQITCHACKRQFQNSTSLAGMFKFPSFLS